jgi:hypothetical protein
MFDAQPIRRTDKMTKMSTSSLNDADVLARLAFIQMLEAPAESEVYVPERYVRAWLDAGLIAVHPTV